MTPRRAAVSRHQSRRISRSAARPSERHSGAPVLQVAPPIKTPRPPDGTPRISGTRVRRQVESAHPAVNLPAELNLFDGPRCSQCAGPLPDGSRCDRETCSPACRQRASRHARSVTSETAPAVVRHSTPETAATVQEHAPLTTVAPPRLPLPIEVRHVPGEWLSNGYPSGIGGRTTYHVGGRSFDTPREALDFAGR